MVLYLLSLVSREVLGAAAVYVSPSTCKFDEALVFGPFRTWYVTPFLGP